MMGWAPQHTDPLGVAVIIILGMGSLLGGYLVVAWVGDLRVVVSQRTYQLRQGFWPLHRMLEGTLDDVAGIKIVEETDVDAEGVAIRQLVAKLMWKDGRRKAYDLCSRPDAEMDGVDAIMPRPRDFLPVLAAFAEELGALLALPVLPSPLEQASPPAER
jgi:hypothetical protein